MSKLNPPYDKRTSLVFLALLLAFFYYLSFFDTLFYSPRGIHFFRQTDSLAFVSNYFYFTLNFFEPGILNIVNGSGKAVSEFPILYYVTAILYKLVGEQEFILRLLNIILVSFGFYCLVKMLIMAINDRFYAYGFTFLFFSSTVVVYYTNNYLPDAPTLGLSLAGWYYFYQYYSNNKPTRSGILAFFFFTFAGLLKITSFINPLAAMGTLVILAFKNKNTLQEWISRHKAVVLSFFASVSILSLWNWFVIDYHSQHQSPFFLLHTKPIWAMDKKSMIIVWDHIKGLWFHDYLSSQAYQVFSLLILLSLFSFKKFNPFFLYASLLISFGALCFVLLFFEQFRDHDYYFLTLIPVAIIIFINAFLSARAIFPLLVSSYLSKGIFLLLCLWSIQHAKSTVNARYAITDDPFASIGVKLAGLKPFLLENGVGQEAKVVILTDLTPNGGLYTIGRRGWSIPTAENNGIEELNAYKENGAEFVIVTDKSYLENIKLTELLGEKLGEKNNISLFTLSRK